MRAVSDDEVTEVLRLAGLLATARVRRYAKKTGSAPLESMAQIDKRIAKSKKALADYVRTIAQEQETV